MRHNEICKGCSFEHNDWMPCEVCKNSGEWYWYSPKNLRFHKVPYKEDDFTVGTE